MTHLTLQLRTLIVAMLHEHQGVSVIAGRIGKHRSTVCRELMAHRQVVGVGDEPECPELERPPYVCNGCARFNGCRLRRYVYVAESADRDYRSRLVDSRSGVNITGEELYRIGAAISEGVRKGQSLHHVMATCDGIGICEKTAYRYVHEGYLDVRTHHLPQAPYRRPRRCLKPRRAMAQRRGDRECLKGRTYEDWKAFMKGHPGAETVEIDSVIGRIGGKCLLTMNFNCCGLMLAFLRDRNDAGSVKDVFDALFARLGEKRFREMFPVLLADNGTEFSSPDGIERCADGRKRTSLFYCNPYASYEKPHVENNHENLRKILPKGTGFDDLTQEDIDLALCHVNSMRRRGYRDRTAIERFAERFGQKALELVGLRPVPDREVCLLPALLKRG